MEHTHDTITITKTEYHKLVEARDMLDKLHYGGVDNWIGYGEALDPEDEPDMFDDNRGDIV